MFIDTHLHLYQEYYEDIDEIIKRALEKKIIGFITNGCDDKSNKEVLKIIAKYQNVYGALGIHPEQVDTYQESDLEFIRKNLDKKKIVAIGEIGLDYHYTKDNKEKQIELFEKQLKMAQEYQKPVIVHSREATEDTIRILKKYKVTGVIHSFSGSLEIAQIYLKMGFKLGINGVVTFKNAHLIEVVKNLDLTSFVLETDSPYLTPTPYRGQKNEPAHILDIALFICEACNISLEELSKITNENIKNIFDI